MFTPITFTADPELQTSQNNTEYVQFNVAVNKGFGEQETYTALRWLPHTH